MLTRFPRSLNAALKFVRVTGVAAAMFGFAMVKLTLAGETVQSARAIRRRAGTGGEVMTDTRFTRLQCKPRSRARAVVAEPQSPSCSFDARRTRCRAPSMNGRLREAVR